MDEAELQHAASIGVARFLDTLPATHPKLRGAMHWHDGATTPCGESIGSVPSQNERLLSVRCGECDRKLRSRWRRRLKETGIDVDQIRQIEDDE